LKKDDDDDDDDELRRGSKAPPTLTSATDGETESHINYYGKQKPGYKRMTSTT
jgi:hypothetical protein